MSGSFDPSAAAGPESGLFGLDTTRDDAGVWVLPVPFDATCSYRRGAAGGPAAVLAASRQVDLYDLCTGRPYEAGLWMAPIPSRVEAWNDEARVLADPILAAGGAEGDAARLAAAERVDVLQRELDAWLGGEVANGLDADKLVCVLGGDHSVPFASIQAHAERHAGLGVLHFDAHADLRAGFEGFPRSHASILHRVVTELPGVARVLQVGVRDLCEEEREAIDGERVRAVFGPEWDDLRTEGANLRARIRRELAWLPREVYVTFDVDGLEPALCPNTGTPVPGGLGWGEAMAWLEELVRSGRRVVGLDLCEVAPGTEREPGQGIDELVGARLLYRLIGYALASR